MLTGEVAGLAMILGSLEELTATQNGVYEPVETRGFKKVTVNVDGGQYAQCAEEVAEMLDIDTSQDWDCDDIKNAILTLQTDLQDMQDCAEDVANILGVDTSQSWDCDDVKDKAQEDEDKLDELEECCDEVLEVIQQYDPDYDPTDPTVPTIPEEIADVIDDVKGYTFPEDTEYEDIIDIVPDPVEDVDIAVSLQWGVWIEATHSDGLNPDFPYEHVFYPYKYINAALMQTIGIEPYQSAGNPPMYGNFSFAIKIVTSSGNVIENNITAGGGLWGSQNFRYSLVNYSLNGTTGKITASFRTTYDGYDHTDGPYTNTFTQLIGYGAAGHRFKARNG